MLNRRTVILAAGGASLALVGGYGAFRVTRQPRTAAAPWTITDTAPADVRLDALRHAILAPNPHNRQPWLMRLVGTDTVEVTCDLERRLPETDPFDRQITIGFGGFLEIARIAAAQRGFQMTIDAFPDGEPSPRLDSRPIARIRFTPQPTIARDPLYGAILRRRSNKEPYNSNRPVQPITIRTLTAVGTDEVAVEGTNAAAEVGAIRAVVVDAIRTEIDLPRTYLESVRLIRIGSAEIDANPDGVDLRGPLFEGLKAIGQIDRDRLADPDSAMFKAGRDQLLESYGSAPAFVWLKTANPGRRAQLAAGRVHVRTNLAATTIGLSMHPVSQALQEYPEMADLSQRLRKTLNAGPGEQVQMLSRLGYGPAVGPSPRWPLETRLTRI